MVKFKKQSKTFRLSQINIDRIELLAIQMCVSQVEVLEDLIEFGTVIFNDCLFNNNFNDECSRLTSNWRTKLVMCKKMKRDIEMSNENNKQI